MALIASEKEFLEKAQTLDEQDEIKQFRNEFIIPTRADLRRKVLSEGTYYERESGQSIEVMAMVDSLFGHDRHHTAQCIS